MARWIEPADPIVAGMWPDADAIEPSILAHLFDTAQVVLEAYAPSLVVDNGDGTTTTTPPPATYKTALILEVREVWNAAQREGSADLIGLADYAVRARPLSTVVGALLRPPAPGRVTFG